MDSQTEISREQLNAAVWRKSSRSGPNCDNCVEIAQVRHVAAVRDSTRTRGPVLAFPGAVWQEFLDSLR